ncbi:hypothetical protein EV188_10119 [Actinomycetospora succinea]|uniref:Uncharacterized protein n=1 Tax=Actinomycetospora succinea TaxID=663603 RepID=A0A4R6VLX4_9PSEU|nr:hypothetical protein [Actinomycetospora succinea]TDQ64772.1 hypothetical protein EV188_10119 [Actinomycetospora succinea]
MFVSVSTDGTGVREADDLQRLHVATDLDPGTAGAALRGAGLGDVDADGTARLDVTALRDLARAAATREDWDDAWRTMIDHAIGKGWVSDDGRTVQAHLAPPD